MLSQVVPTFLYPTSRRYLFDELCERIVRALEKRNWQVPGMTVKFDTYGSGEQKMRIVREISGSDFRLRFGRPQKLLPGGKWNDVAAISDLIIPRFELSVYSDNSDATLYVYVGKYWETDKKWFLESTKLHSKIDRRPRRYLRYKGQIVGSSRGVLVSDNDLGREYDPRIGEKDSYEAFTVFNEVYNWLFANVLAVILKQPEQEPVVPVVPDRVPFPTEVFPKIYTRVQPNDVRKIICGQENLNNLHPAERFALSGGRRLLTDTYPNDTVLPEANNGFIWCVTDRVCPGTVIEDILEEVSASYETELVQVVPDSADDVYVIDFAVMDQYKQDLLEKDPDIRVMNNAQFAELKHTLARTLVPVSRYTGGYRDPLILISRELDFHEVKILDAAK